jgi:hypothetical protein
MNPRIGPKRAPTSSNIAAIFVDKSVKRNKLVNRVSLVARTLLGLKSPFLFLMKGLKNLSFSNISMIVMILNGTEKRGLNATKNFNLWRILDAE